MLQIYVQNIVSKKNFSTECFFGWHLEGSVADPGCLSRIPDPDFYPSRIPDLGSRIQKQQQKRGEKKSVVIPFYVATNFTKL
jgi:hypothetical protein